VLPTTFNWPMFWLAFLLMALPLLATQWRWKPPSGRLPIEPART
jgi:ABC-type dipeptide/oligopeptide/nickel transport system permease component